jgi:SAM-dependent methyltransferase
MHVTGPLSRHFDESLVVLPERRGAVAWGQFNHHYERLQITPWRKINAGGRHPWHRRLARLLMAWFIQRTDGIVDLRRKAKALARLPIPRDPDIVFFGAEVGWEAALVQALHGDRGRVVLVDADPAAYQRFLQAPTERRAGKLVVTRRPERVEYVQQDFFDWAEPGGFDLGIDWGLLEHYPGDRKRAVVDRFRASVRPGGLQLSAVPRDPFAIRSIYRTFGDELNFGYRELLSMAELVSVLESAGLQVAARATTPSTCIALSRFP